MDEAHPSSLAADRTPYRAWLAILQRHHDHALRVIDPETRSSLGASRRPSSANECNGADGTAKRLLRLPCDWSFSPAEIAQFITGQPHARHRVDCAAAARLHAGAASQDTSEIVERGVAMTVSGASR